MAHINEISTTLDSKQQHSHPLLPHKKKRSISQSKTTIRAQDDPQSSFLSTKKATVQFTSNTPANLSPIDSFILTLTSDRTSLALGSIGITILLINRLLTFPEGEGSVIYEASRSRIDLLGVFAAGSLLLNGITKLDVTSVQAERVALEGVKSDDVIWNDERGEDDFAEIAEWALSSFIKCPPARTVVLLSTTGESNNWKPIALTGIVPPDSDLQSSILNDINTPILDRMKRYDETSGKGGSVGSSTWQGRGRYLPTLQALPGRVEFTFLPANTQEVLVLPVPTEGALVGASDGMYFAVVLGGDTAKSFTPRDIAWCHEVSAWIGDSLNH
jgi:hypothetical protein